MSTWWLSFCDPERPEGKRFTGVALVEATTLTDALTRACRAGCNPGGEVKAVPLPDDLTIFPEERQVALANAPRDTLHSRDRLAELGLLD